MLQEKAAEPRARKPLLPADRPDGSEGPEPIPFDRRRNGREAATGSVMAAFVSDEAGITLARVELRDASAGGAGMKCPLWIEPGTRFSLYRDGAPLSADRGIVARCSGLKDHFVLGLKFDERLGAAA